MMHIDDLQGGQNLELLNKLAKIAQELYVLGSPQHKSSQLCCTHMITLTRTLTCRCTLAGNTKDTRVYIEYTSRCVHETLQSLTQRWHANTLRSLKNTQNTCSQHTVKHACNTTHTQSVLVTWQQRLDCEYTNLFRLICRIRKLDLVNSLEKNLIANELCVESSMRWISQRNVSESPQP